MPTKIRKAKEKDPNLLVVSDSKNKRHNQFTIDHSKVNNTKFQ